MRVVNVLFNHKKKSHDNKPLGVERCFIDYSKYLSFYGAAVLSVYKKGISYVEELKYLNSRNLEVEAANPFDIVSIFKMVVAFYKFKPNVAICHSGRALSLTRAVRFFMPFNKFTIIAINHGLNAEKFLKADYILSVNSYFAKKIVELGKPKDRSLVIPNMIEIPANFQKLTKPNFHKPVRLGYLGRLASEKSLDSILHAVAILKDRNVDSEFYIGGVGREEERLKQIAKDLKIEKSVKFLSWTSDKKKFFEEIDIFTLPSRYETFGIVLLEAMLYSTPIITSNSWGPDEVITQNVNGVKVDKNDNAKLPTLIADAVEKMVKDEEFARMLAENAYKEFFMKYTAEIVTKRLYDLCEMIYARRS